MVTSQGNGYGTQSIEVYITNLASQLGAHCLLFELG